MIERILTFTVIACFCFGLIFAFLSEGESKRNLANLYKMLAILFFVLFVIIPCFL